MVRKNEEKRKKDIGLGLPAPKEVCNDVKCPWHGKLPVRGKIAEGIVKSTRSRNTAIVEVHYHRYVPKYERYEKRKSRIVAYKPPCLKAKEGDSVVIAECRPLSKTKSFVVVHVKGEGK